MTQAVAGQLEHHHDDEHASAEQVENLKLATWLYIASETVIFAVLIGAFAVFRIFEPQYAEAFHNELGVGLVTINTFILLASSYAMVMALRAAEMSNRQGFMQWMGAVLGMGTLFVILQFVEYSELSHLQITLDGSGGEFGRFGMYFYAPTFFHGAHVFAGVLMGLEVLRRGARGDFDGNAIILELFGLYWHFVDVVWIILFALIYLV